MNTDNILQKGRLGTTQTGEEEREAYVLNDHLLARLWDSQWGNSALQVSRVASILRQWPSVSWAVKHPWEEEEILNL